MNWVDRAVTAVSPVTGLRRQAARRMLERTAPQTRAASGPRYSGRERDFYINTGDPNDARPKRFVDRMTILRLVAENPFARKGLNALLNSLIGWGVTAAPKGSKKLVDAWEEWVKVCDFNGRLNLYGLQELWGRSMFRDGEVFIVPRFVEGAGANPLRLQTFDKGMLATSKVGANIERGIEFDADGRAVRFHFYRGRQGRRWSSTDTISFPAEQVIHLFHTEWVGQTEGVSVFESVVKRLGDVEEGIEAEVVKANIAACLVGFRYRPPGQEGEDDTIGMPVAARDGDRPPVEELVPGTVETLEDGEQITFSNPPRSGGIGDLARIALLASAAGVGVTAEQLTGDVSQVNFSSFKAGHLEFKRSIGRIQYLTFIPVCLDRVWAWFLQAGIDFGLYPNRPVPCEWTPPPFETIDRLGEAQADELEMQLGLESRENLLNARGFTLDGMMTQISEGQKALKKLGLAFKGDPFSPTQTGAAGAETQADADRLLTLALARHLFAAAPTPAA